MLPTAGALHPLTLDRTTDTIAVLDPASRPDRYFAAADERHDGAHGAAGDAAGAPKPKSAISRITDRNGNWLDRHPRHGRVPSQVDHVGSVPDRGSTPRTRHPLPGRSLRLIDAAHPEGVPIGRLQLRPAGRLVESLDADDVPLHLTDTTTSIASPAWIRSRRLHTTTRSTTAAATSRTSAAMSPRFGATFDTTSKPAARRLARQLSGGHRVLVQRTQPP